ncbi:hypothetical protein NliqN6_6460 [Naganishia liquefaciens]|uniref:Autophagy protein 5 n=1 Tax=Naganishia liquefaciens TaxID=104408 RepID=A0A8H3TZQ2_9TREE|nr:hypothetical protein NliqN6_6460 [Naganishia liquefaciens]
MAPDLTQDTLASARSHASVFRLLTWKATIPLEIRISRDSLPRASEGDVVGGGAGEEGQEDDDDGVPTYYMQAPRFTYPALVLSEIEQVFLPSIIPQEQLSGAFLRYHANQAEGYRREDYWFEVEWEGPAGLEREICKWHWSLDLIQLHTIINSRPDSPTRHINPPSPLRLLLHLKPRRVEGAPTSISSPSNSEESCRIAFISLLKEADYIRWGNTRRITGLRRADLESAWEGVAEHDYETHSRFASKVVPLPLTAAKSSDPSQTSTSENLGVSGPESCFAVRSIPLKLYLPDNAPEVQDIVNPLNSQGNPTTILKLLNDTLPRLFPHVEPCDAAYALATPILNAVPIPPEAEIAWLAACVAAPDGWLRIGIRLS